MPPKASARYVESQRIMNARTEMRVEYAKFKIVWALHDMREKYSVRFFPDSKETVNAIIRDRELILDTLTKVSRIGTDLKALNEALKFFCNYTKGPIKAHVNGNPVYIDKIRCLVKDDQSNDEIIKAATAANGGIYTNIEIEESLEDEAVYHMAASTSSQKKPQPSDESTYLSLAAQKIESTTYALPADTLGGYDDLTASRTSWSPSNDVFAGVWLGDEAEPRVLKSGVAVPPPVVSGTIAISGAVTIACSSNTAWQFSQFGEPVFVDTHATETYSPLFRGEATADLTTAFAPATMHSHQQLAVARADVAGPSTDGEVLWGIPKWAPVVFATESFEAGTLPPAAVRGADHDSGESVFKIFKLRPFRDDMEIDQVQNLMIGTFVHRSADDSGIVVDLGGCPVF